MNDEQEIRALVETWMNASKKGDTNTVLSLMTDDVVFMVPGQEPFGKEAFRKSSEYMKTLLVDGKADIQEIKILGTWAYLRNYLEITTTTPNGKPITRKGYTLTILRKEKNGWKLARDANLLN